MEVVFYDTLLDQLEILREHVDGRGPSDISSVLRFMRFARDPLAAAVDLVPKLAAVIVGIGAILS